MCRARRPFWLPRRGALRPRAPPASPAGASRTPSPSQDRGEGPPLVLRGRRGTLVSLPLGDLLQGNRRCSRPAGSEGQGSPRARRAQPPGGGPGAPPRCRTRAPRPRRGDSSLLRTGAGAGGRCDPRPEPPEAGGACASGRASHPLQLRPSLLALGEGGSESDSTGDTTGTEEETSWA